jgi:2-dehydropantoate 2-reductase
MRYIIYGAGAIGGTIGASLFEAGRDVVLIARGEHGRTIAAKGLRFGSPLGGWRVLPIPVVEGPADLTIGAGDVVVLAMKSQDTETALEALALVASPDVQIVCAQNGVANERMALRHFPNVHGLCVRMPGVHLEPGVVAVHQPDCNGIADVGRFPSGVDDVDRAIAADLEAASIKSYALEDVMAQKYAKLALNVTNALEAAIGMSAPETDLSKRARKEALTVFAAAGIAVATGPDTRTADRSRVPVEGVAHAGNSAFQSLARGNPRLEADYLNGEVVLLGRLHGIPTPANEFLQGLAMRLVKAHVAAGSLTIADVEAGRPGVAAPAAV